MRVVLAWLRSHPKSTIAAAVLVLIFGAHRFLDWNTERQWQQYRAEAGARGVKFTLEELVTPEIPDHENFAALPMWQAARAAPPGAVRFFELPQVPYDDPIKKIGMDWDIWQFALRRRGFLSETTNDPVADVLRGLDSFAPQVSQWRKWKERPRTRFPFDPKEGLFERRTPEYGGTQNAAAFFNVRMRAHLAQRKSARAGEDFADGLQSYRALKGNPFLLAAMIRLRLLESLIAGVGTGLSFQAWQEPELAALETALREISIHQDVRFAISTERVFANAFYEEMIRDPAKNEIWFWALNSPPRLSARWEKLMFRSMSRRRLRKSQMRSNRDYDEVLAALEAQPSAQLVPVKWGRQPEPNLFEQWQFYPYHAIESPGGRKSYFKQAARLENLIVHCRIAIALERYRLMRGNFPDELTSLIPSLLPEPLRDPWTGRSVIFSRVGSSFRLYSTGRDRVDDRGEINPKKPDTEQRDEIWLYAPP